MRLNSTFRFLDKMILVHVQTMKIPKSPTRGVSADKFQTLLTTSYFWTMTTSMTKA